MGKSTVFNGNFVKLLKTNINLKDAAYVLTGSADPRSVATTAPKGSIYLRQNASGNGQIFLKLDDGSSTNWTALALDTVSSNQLLEALKNEMVDSPYELMTPNLFQMDEEAKVDTATATYNPSEKTYEFSEDCGETWTTRTTPALSWNDVCWSHELGLFVAVGNAGAYMYSSDGITWTDVTTGSLFNNAVCWAPELGIFAAVSQTGHPNQISTSTDGITWTAQTTPLSRLWKDICWSPDLGIFVAVAENSTTRVMYSYDGVTWTSAEAAVNNDWQSVCWSPDLGLFVAVADTFASGDQVMTSYDGINWTSQTEASQITWQSVCWSSELGLFVAVANNGSTASVMTSPDGVTWTMGTAASDAGWLSVIWAAEIGQFIAVAQTGSPRGMTSYDGITWVSRTIGVTDLTEVCWSKDLLRAVTVSGGGTSSGASTSDAEYVESVQMLDTEEFLDRSLDVTSIDLTAFYQTTNPATQVFAQASRDGGTNWFPVEMDQVGSTGTWRGNLPFDATYTTETLEQTVYSKTIASGNLLFDDTGFIAWAQPFVLTATTKIQAVVPYLRDGGTAAGSIIASIVRDDGAGLPSTDLDDVIVSTGPVLISSLGLTGTHAPITFELSETVLPAGTYHITFATDADYKTPGTGDVNIWGRTTGGTTPYGSTYNSATSLWQALASGNLQVSVVGRVLDLRVRLIAPQADTYPVSSEGYGVFYSLQDIGIVGGIRKTQRFAFNSVDDNLNEFTITAFSADPDLLTCYYVEGGQVFKVPAFELAGNTVTFPEDSFNNGGVSATVTLIFDQNNGGSFDNSDSNARLLGANHLGSTNGADDRSAPGRGIVLRRPDGTLRELTIDNSDNISILSVT